MYVGRWEEEPRGDVSQEGRERGTEARSPVQVLLGG